MFRYILHQDGGACESSACDDVARINTATWLLLQAAAGSHHGVLRQHQRFCSRYRISVPSPRWPSLTWSTGAPRTPLSPPAQSPDPTVGLPVADRQPALGLLWHVWRSAPARQCSVWSAGPESGKPDNWQLCHRSEVQSSPVWLEVGCSSWFFHAGAGWVQKRPTVKRRLSTHIDQRICARRSQQGSLPVLAPLLHLNFVCTSPATISESTRFHWSTGTFAVSRLLGTTFLESQDFNMDVICDQWHRSTAVFCKEFSNQMWICVRMLPRFHPQSSG